ncbi:ParB/RepB/Spo0J family partition protein, partial [Actinokineospora enzanensis]|uniref:ParB/RepB/Spo0J family partition protein n=1 Tax=Actinokineospora enzanensis TaxID=155975 RepID=UPI00037FF2E0
DDQAADEPQAEVPETAQADADASPEESTGKTAEPAPESSASSGDAGGIAAALAQRASETTATGELLIPASAVAPHPFNSPSRSLPQPGNARWDELVSTVRASGVTVPAKVVTAAAFLAVRPQTADQIGNAEYVVIYGHRRRAACLETGRPLKAIVDDSVMENDGDLEALAQENLGREDLTELEDAQMLARFFEVNKKESQRSLARRLGRDQATISRRLALLKTAPEIQAAITDKKFAATDAAVIGGKLPYEPNGKRDGRESDERLAEQRTAVELVNQGRTATAACEWVIAARASAQQAATEGLDLIEPATAFGDRHYEHACRDEAAATVAREAGLLVATIDKQNGALRYYTKAKPDRPQATDREEAEKAEAKARKDAQTKRREACVKLITSPLPQKQLIDLLSRQYVNGMAHGATSSEAYTLAGKLWFASGLTPNVGDEWKESMRREGTSRILNHHAAWVLAVAAFEIRASQNHREWDALDLEFFELLDERARYVPTEWERLRLAKAITAAEPGDDPEETGEEPAAEPEPAEPEPAA